MKKIICLFALIIVFFVNVSTVYASTFWQEEGKSVLEWSKVHKGDGVYFECLQQDPSPEWAKIGADAGVLSQDEISKLKDMGMLEQSYGTPTTQQPEQPKTESQQPTSTKEESVIVEFSVEVMDTTMWATQNVNVRQGADSVFNKVGSLNKHDEVHVTGKASTGWYEIEKGSLKGYVSGKYLTLTKPSHDMVSVATTEIITSVSTEIISTEVISEETSTIAETETSEETSVIATEDLSKLEATEVTETQENLPTYLAITITMLAIIIVMVIVWLIYKKRK